MADDIDIPEEATAWVPSEAIAFFESGGNELPEIARGFEGAEIHAHYELKQKRFESAGMDEMLDSLSAALFKTTGDEKYKTEEKPAFNPEEHIGSKKREKYYPDLKYAVPQLGDYGSSAMVVDDTNA